MVQVYSYLVPLLILRLPVSLAVAVLYTCITYFAIGLTNSAGRSASGPSALLTTAWDILHAHHCRV